MKRPSLITVLILLIAGVLLVSFFRALDWDIFEFVRFSLGIVLLWGPLGILIYLLLVHEVEDRLARFTVSTIGSYTLTTFAWMVFAELHLDAFFYIGQLIIGVCCGVWVIQHRSWRSLGSMLNTSWRHTAILLFVLAGSLVCSIEYDKAIYKLPGDRGVVFALANDVLYAVGQSYGLAQHIPLQQSPIRAGTPERAYHFLSHITTMLIARFD